MTTQVSVNVAWIGKRIFLTVMNAPRGATVADLIYAANLSEILSEPKMQINQSDRVYQGGVPVGRQHKIVVGTKYFVNRS